MKTRNSTISLDDVGRNAARLKTALPDCELPRNSGKRRTASKKALLKAIEQTGARW
ncbi:MAG: hypothetical protein AAGH53_07880 [Pseudomonadota bacterium]